MLAAQVGLETQLVGTIGNAAPTTVHLCCSVSVVDNRVVYRPHLA